MELWPNNEHAAPADPADPHVMALTWTTVGYHAIDQSDYDKSVEQDKSDEWYIEIRPMVWCPNRMQAIGQTRKDTVKKIGITLSEPPEPPTKSPGKAAGGKKRSTCIDSGLLGPEAWQQSNYMIMRLRTRENLAEAIASKSLASMPNGCLEMRDSFMPFSPLSLPGAWDLDLT